MKGIQIRKTSEVIIETDSQRGGELPMQTDDGEEGQLGHYYELDKLSGRVL